VQKILIRLLAPFGVVLCVDVIDIDAVLGQPFEGTGKVFKNAVGAKVFWLAGQFPFPAAANGDVVKEDEAVQVVYEQVRVSTPGGGNANDFGAFSHGARCIEQRLFVPRAFNGELELTRKVGIFQWYGIQYIVDPVSEAICRRDVTGSLA